MHTMAKIQDIKQAKTLVEVLGFSDDEAEYTKMTKAIEEKNWAEYLIKCNNRPHPIYLRVHIERMKLLK